MGNIAFTVLHLMVYLSGGLLFFPVEHGGLRIEQDQEPRHTQESRHTGEEMAVLCVASHHPMGVFAHFDDPDHRNAQTLLTHYGREHYHVTMIALVNDLESPPKPRGLPQEPAPVPVEERVRTDFMRKRYLPTLLRLIQWGLSIVTLVVATDITKHNERTGDERMSALMAAKAQPLHPIRASHPFSLYGLTTIIKRAYRHLLQFQKSG